MRQSRSEVLTDRADQVVSLIAHPSRPLLFSGSWKKVHVLDLDTRLLLHTLAGHTDYIWGLALCPKDKRLASVSFDRSVRLWDLESGELLTLAWHSSAVFAVAWEATGSLLALGSSDKTIRVWDADNGELRHCLKGHTDWVHALVAHPRDDLLASGSEDTTVRLWRFSSGLCLRTLAGHTRPVSSLAASKEWLVSGSMDRTLRVWSWATGVCARVLETTEHPRLNSLTWRDSRLIALGWTGKHGTVRVWETRSPDPRAWSCVGSLKEKASSPCGVAAVGGGRVVFSAGSKLTAVALETPVEARARRRRLARAR